jgi:hypothetical protein
LSKYPFWFWRETISFTILLQQIEKYTPQWENEQTRRSHRERILSLSDFSIMFHTDKTRVVCNMVAITCQTKSGSNVWWFWFPPTYGHFRFEKKTGSRIAVNLALILPTCLSRTCQLLPVENQKSVWNAVSPTRAVERGKTLKLVRPCRFQDDLLEEEFERFLDEGTRTTVKTKGANNFQIREGPRW